MGIHRFELAARWSGGLHGAGELASGKLGTAISVPAELAGPGVGSNPEELLLGAAAACYLISLAALVQRQGIERLELVSELFVAASPAMKVDKIVHKPVIAVPPGFTQEQADRLRKAAVRAERTCMISKALKGNVDIVVEPALHFM